MDLPFIFLWPIIHFSKVWACREPMAQKVNGRYPGCIVAYQIEHRFAKHHTYTPVYHTIWLCFLCIQWENCDRPVEKLASPCQPGCREAQRSCPDVTALVANCSTMSWGNAFASFFFGLLIPRSLVHHFDFKNTLAIRYGRILRIFHPFSHLDMVSSSSKTFRLAVACCFRHLYRHLLQATADLVSIWGYLAILAGSGKHITLRPNWSKDTMLLADKSEVTGARKDAESQH